MGKVVIDEEMCKECGLCIEFCPVKALAKGDKLNKKGKYYTILAHPEKCTGCGTCALMCPDAAIEVWR